MINPQLKNLFKNLPSGPSVYIFKNANLIPIYIGKAKNTKMRLASYKQNERILLDKTQKMISQVSKLELIPVESEIEALLLEASLIKKYKPKYNTVLKDDKSYLYIKIDKTATVPLITTARREKSSSKVILFGPFPSTSKVKFVLKLIRSIFPYCIHKRKQSSCLYIHLGLCPNPYYSDEKKQYYLRNVENIKLFLQGKKKQLLLKLKREMKQKALSLEFETANEIKRKIDQIESITTQFRSPDEYIENPNLLADITLEKLNTLKNILDLHDIPIRIECYDISNIQGRLATGSMVVFTNGQPEKSEYRKFKIRAKAKPNDPLMINEVLSRRFKNNWALPDLIIIDGGKTQLTAALKAVNGAKLDIKVITLAKRLEQIYTSNNLEPITLQRSNPALQLIQSLRDEAHRFAVSYHRKLRQAQAFDLIKKRMLT